MLRKINTPTTNELWQAIANDFQYDNRTQGGLIQKYWSQNMPPHLFYALREAEAFVDKVTKTKQPAFKLDRTICHTRVIATSLASAFYQLIEELGPYLSSFPLPGQELSEKAELLVLIFNRQGVPRAVFQGNPTHLIGADGLLECDYINGIIECVRKEANRSAFIKKAKQRQRETKQITTKLRGVLPTIQSHPQLEGLSLTLSYLPSPKKRTPLTCNKNIKRLLEDLAEWGGFGKIEGFFWTRQFLSECGFQFRLIIVFTQTAPLTQGERDLKISTAWRHAAGDNAIVSCCDVIRDKEKIHRESQIMALKTQYLRPLHDGHDQFGMSAPAKLIAQPVRHCRPARLEIANQREIRGAQ